MSTKYQTGGKQIRCLSALRIEGMKPPEEWQCMRVIVLLQVR